MVKTASIIRKMSSFRANKEDLIRYSDRPDPALSSLIGYIDHMGVFRLNIHQDEVYLLSKDMIENIGFFDKLSFESTLKGWHKDVNYALYFLILMELWGPDPVSYTSVD